MDDQPVGAERDERQRAQAGERVVGRRGPEHRLQQRHGRAPQDAGGVQRLPGGGVQLGQVHARQLRGGLAHHGVLAADQRRRRGGDQLQRQWVPADGAVDARRRAVDGTPRRRSSSTASDGREAVELQRGHQLAVGGAPGRQRRVAPGEHDARVDGQRGHEHAPQPVVEQAQALVGVDRDHHAPVERGQRAGVAACGVSTSTPSALDSLRRKPASVGSVRSPSTAITAAPAACASAANARSSADLPIPAMPHTKATAGRSWSSSSSRNARSASRPTKASSRSLIRVCRVRVTIVSRGVCREPTAITRAGGRSPSA